MFNFIEDFVQIEYQQKFSNQDFHNIQIILMDSIHYYFLLNTSFSLIVNFVV